MEIERTVIIVQLPLFKQKTITFLLHEEPTMDTFLVAKTCECGGVAESVDALDSKSRSQYVSEGSSPSAPTLKETHCVSFLVLVFIDLMTQSHESKIHLPCS